jgi:hypothetical protein
MKCTSNPTSAPAQTNHTRNSRALSYEYLAGAMAAKMTGLLRASHAGSAFPPFQVVILSQQGTVVFEYEVNRNGKVRHRDRMHRVRRSHFPATVFFTDRSQMTRTFLLERSKRRAA